ncbi:unnamed protein product, partial [Durusdinium trenchii]
MCTFAGLNPLQPRNQWEPDGPESDGEGESGAASDGLIYDQNDYEVEETEDAWFDQFISTGLSGSTDQSDVVVEESEPVLPDHSSQTTPVLKDVEMAKQPPRPVARPLAPSLNKQAEESVLIEDSPVKMELQEVEDIPVREPTKEEQAQALREQIKHLEQQMKEAETLQAKINADIQSIPPVTGGALMVMESLPMGGDTDPTIPMDLTGGMTAAVAEIIERGERVATPADPPPKEKEQ